MLALAQKNVVAAAVRKPVEHRFDKGDKGGLSATVLDAVRVQPLGEGERIAAELAEALDLYLQYSHTSPPSVPFSAARPSAITLFFCSGVSALSSDTRRTSSPRRELSL